MASSAGFYAKAELDDNRLGLPSASASARLFACPASHSRSESAPELPAGKVADHGTFIHSLLEGEGEMPPENTPDAALVRSLLRQAFAMRQVAFGSYPWETMMVEQRIALCAPEGKIRFTGKPDRVEISEYEGHRAAFVLDYKSGWNPAQEASENDQLRSLAVLVDLLPQGGFDEVYVGISERVADWHGEIALARFDRKDLEAAANDLVNALEESAKPDAPANPGDHCFYCPAKICCGEFISMADEAEAEAKQLSLDMKEEQPIDGERLSRFLKNAKLISKAEEEGRAVALRMLKEDPVSVPGFKVFKGRKIERVEEPASSFIEYVISKRPDLDPERLRATVVDMTKLAANELRDLLARAAEIPYEEAEAMVASAPGYSETFSSDYIRAAGRKVSV